MFKKARIYIIICIAALFQYGNTFEHDYTWDDAIVITGNDRVQQGLSTPSDFFRNIKSNEIQHRYGYRPISLLSFALDVELSEMTPKTGHVMNVLYYALLCCLIFYFLQRMFPEKSQLFSVLIVGLFLIHPVHAEVVANIKSRDEILAMIFGVLSMISFLNFLERDKNNWIFGALSVLALIGSFLSKENGITFVGVLFLIAYFKDSDRIKSYVKFALPTIGGLALIGIRLYVYSDGFFENNATELLESYQYKEDGFIGNPLHDASGLMQILPNVFNILLKDIGLLIFPVTLVHDYGFSHSTIVGWTNPIVLISIVLHSGLVYVLIREFKKKSILLFGILFYFITLSVYLHVIQVGPDYMAERFLFISSLGFLIAVVALLERLTESSFNKDAGPIWKSSTAKWVLGVLGLFFILGFGKTTNRNEAWKNNRTLLEADIEALDDCARTQYNYACLLHADYYKSPSLGKADRILYHYQRAVDISPRSMKAMLDLGSAYMEFGYPEKGKEVFENCEKQHPDLAAPLMQLAKFHMGQEDFQNALNFYTKAGEHTKLSEVNHGKAICLFKLGETEKAISELVTGVKYNPQNPEYFELLSDLQFTTGRKAESIKWLDEAIRLAPNNQSLKVKRSARD